MTGFPRAAAFSVLRIAMGAVAGFYLASLFGFTGAERIAFVLQCAMPVAVYNYLFAQMYNNDPEDVASLVDHFDSVSRSCDDANACSRCW